MPSKNFSKIHSLTPALLEREEKRWKRDLDRQRLRLTPQVGTLVDAIGTFIWPTDEHNPADFLGQGFEALAPIRMEFRCKIWFEKEMGAFKIEGDPVKVKAALVEVRKTYLQIVARELLPMRVYLLINNNTMPANVVLDDAGNGFDKIPRGIGELTYIYPRSNISTDVVRAFELYLPRLQYYHGHLKLRIRLGTFGVDTYTRTSDGIWTFKDFEAMIQKTQFVGHVSRELGQKSDQNNALRRLQQADTLLEPRDVMTPSLQDVKPTYTAVFTFGDAAGDIQLTRTWKEEQTFSSSSSVDFEIVCTRWTRLDQTTGAAMPRIDVNLLDLDNGSGWHFGMLSSRSIETRLPPSIADFTHTLDINAAKDKMPSFTFSKRTALKSVEQYASYSFVIRDTDYTLELTRLQTANAPGLTLTKPLWAVSVYREAWDSMLTENENLRVGKKTRWPYDGKDWFPGGTTGSEGIELLIEKLKLIQLLVRPSVSG